MRQRDTSPGRALLMVFIRFLPLWIVLSILIAGAILFLPLFGKPLIQLVQTEDRSASELILEEIRDVYRVNTVEFVYKVVFPWDFKAGNVSEIQILRKISANFSRPPESFLSPEELTWLKVLDLVKRNKLKTTSPDYQFLVASVVVKAGFDLTGTGLDSPTGMSAAQKNALIRLSSTSHDGTQHKQATIALPPVTITDVTIEDPIRDQYPFPDIEISPEAWKEVAGLIRDYGTKRSISEGILDTARTNVRALLSELLAAAGVDEVSFK